MGTSTDRRQCGISEFVSCELAEGIALITIANSPVNALSNSVRAGILAAIELFAADGTADAAVVPGGGRLFISGADISEFGEPQPAPCVPEVILALEKCRNRWSQRFMAQPLEAAWKSPWVRTTVLP